MENRGWKLVFTNTINEMLVYTFENPKAPLAGTKQNSANTGLNSSSSTGKLIKLKASEQGPPNRPSSVKLSGAPPSSSNSNLTSNTKRPSSVPPVSSSGVYSFNVNKKNFGDGSATPKRGSNKLIRVDDADSLSDGDNEDLINLNDDNNNNNNNNNNSNDRSRISTKRHSASAIVTKRPIALKDMQPIDDISSGSSRDDRVPTMATMSRTMGGEKQLGSTKLHSDSEPNTEEEEERQGDMVRLADEEALERAIKKKEEERKKQVSKKPKKNFEKI